MIQTTIQPTAKKRDVQIAEIGINTQVWRSRTWDRLKFEVEYSRQKGTTSNSYLIQADKIALIDPPGQSFTNIYLEAIAHHEWRKLDYIILQHVNPNRLATIQVLAGYAPTQIQTALGIVLANAAKTKLAGVFGSYGWSGEAITLLENKLRDAHYSFGFEPIRVRFSPTTTILKECIQAGQEFSQRLKKTKRLRTPRQAVTETQIDRTEQAVGRIVGSLCVLTTCKDDRHSGVLTSWVSQATFNPPGLMIASPEPNGDSINPGDKLVLNILNEGRNIRRHFCARSNNSLDNITTQTATNGCLVIEEALAYLECTIQSSLKCGDHTLVYAVVAVELQLC